MPRKPSPGQVGISRLVTRILKGRIQELQYTQLHVAYMAGISQSQLSRILSFEKGMTIDQCEDICIALSLPIPDVFELAIDERVWGTQSEVVVDGHLIAADPLSDEELYELRVASGTRDADFREQMRNVANFNEGAPPTSIQDSKLHPMSDHDALIDRINAGVEPIAAQEATEPLEENWT